MPLVKCPNCNKMAEYNGNEYRPFCSERCQLLDFGAWADEQFALPAEGQELSGEDMALLEEALNEKNL